jgi:hypothetical protein
VAALQEYMSGLGVGFGVGFGVGTGVGGTGVGLVQVAMQLPGACEPARSAAHLPTEESQL